MKRRLIQQPMAMMRTALALVAALALGTALAGCSRFPELDETVTAAARAQPYPELVPLSGLQHRLDTPRITPETAPTLEARVERLNARAARLRGSVIDADTQARMQAGVQQ